MSADVNPVLASIQAAQAQTTANTNQVVDLQNQQAGLQSNFMVEAQNAADAVQLVSSTEGIAKLATQNMALRLARMAGGDINDTATDQLTPLSTRLTNLDHQSDVDFENYRKASQVNFFDDPFQWINSKLLGGEEQARTQYNNTATAYNSTKDRISNIEQQTEAGATLARSIEQPLTAASVTATAQVARVQMDKVATDAAYTVLGSHINAINEMQKGNLEQVNLQLNAFNAAKSADELSMRRQEFAVVMADKQNQLDADAYFSKVFVAGSAARGLPMPDLGNVKLQLQLYKSNPQSRAELQPILDSGAMAMAHPGQIFFGNTPGDVYHSITTGPSHFDDNNPITPGLKFIASLGQDLPQNMVNAKPAELNQFLNNKAKLAFAPLQNDAEASALTSDKGFEGTLKTNPTLLTTPWYQQVIKPLVESNVTKLSAEQVAQTTYKAVDAGKISLEEAATGVGQYYNTVNTANNQFNSPSGLPATIAYNAKLSGGGLFADKVTMSNPTAFKSWLLLQQVRSAIKTINPLGDTSGQ